MEKFNALDILKWESTPNLQNSQTDSWCEAAASYLYIMAGKHGVIVLHLWHGSVSLGQFSHQSDTESWVFGLYTTCTEYGYLRS